MDRNEVKTILRDTIKESIKIAKNRIDLSEPLSVIEEQKRIYLEIQNLMGHADPDRHEIFRLGRLIIQLSYILDENIPDIIH